MSTSPARTRVADIATSILTPLAIPAAVAAIICLYLTQPYGTYEATSVLDAWILGVVAAVCVAFATGFFWVARRQHSRHRPATAATAIVGAATMLSFALGALIPVSPWSDNCNAGSGAMPNQFSPLAFLPLALGLVFAAIYWVRTARYWPTWVRITLAVLVATPLVAGLALLVVVGYFWGDGWWLPLRPVSHSQTLMACFDKF